MKRHSAGVVRLALAILVGALAWGQQTPQVPRAIHGQLRLADGRPATLGITVYLEGQSGGMAGQTQTDRSGKFEFMQISAGQYVVRVRLHGYREIAEPVDLTFMPTAYLSLVLQPDRNTSDSGKPGGVVTVKSFNIPEPARKDLAEGKQLLSKGTDFDKSIERFKKAIAAYPDYAEAYLLMGIAYRAKRQWNDAGSALHKAIELDANSGPAYLALGELQNQQKDYAAAEKSLLKALELSPESPAAQLELARTYWALGRWPEAEPHAVKAIALNPDIAEAHVVLGNILLRKRDAPGALKEFEESLRLDPSGPMADATRQLVIKLKAALKQPQ